MRAQVLVLAWIVGCGGAGNPRLPAADGGSVLDGGARADGGPSKDGGLPADAGTTSYQDCPLPPDGGAPAKSVLLMSPGTGEVLGSIDLSCFAENPDRLPRPYAMLRAHGKVYVALQDFDRFFSNHQRAKIIAIDTANDRVLRKIDLAGRKNLSDLRLGPDGRIYAVSQGILGLETSTFSVEQELSGGIDVIDPGTDAVVASTDDDAFGGNTTLVAVVSATRAYAVVAVFGPQPGLTFRENRYHVKRFDPGTGNVQGQSLFQTAGSLSFVSSLLYERVSGTLFVAEADFSAPRIVALREPEGTVDPSREVALSLTPQGVDLYEAEGRRVLVAVEPDYAAGVGVVETVDLAGSPPLTAVTRADPTSSDPVVRVTPTVQGKPLVFVVNRYLADNLQWLDPNLGFATKIVGGAKAQWSTGNGTNPQDVMAVSEGKVYVTLQN